jgi:hypothetical protein
MFYIPMPFSLSAGILLIFFWQETTMKSAISINMWLGKLRIPAVIFCGLLFVLDLVVEVSKSTPPALQFVRAHIIVVAIIVCALGIFYLVTSFRIFRALGDSQSSNTDAHKKRVRRVRQPVGAVALEPILPILPFQMTRRLIAGGVCYMALVVVSVIDAVDWSNSVTIHRGIILYVPSGFTHGRLLFFFRDLFMNTAAILTALSFAAAVLRKKPTSTGSGTSRTNSKNRMISSSSSDLTDTHGSSKNDDGMA